jgi:FAD-dependent urate hydroxylase
MRDLKIVIVGAGVGGLCTAIASRRAGFDVAVYERAPTIEAVGAGLCIYSNGARVLNYLGLESKMAELSPNMSAVTFYTQGNDLLSRIPTEPLVAATGQRPYPIKRAALQMALLDELGPEFVTLGAEFESLEETSAEVTAHFKNGHAATGDVLVGADGIRSAVRGFVIDGTAEIRYLSTDWEGLGPRNPDFGPTDEFVFYVGEGKRAAALPISQDESYWFFDFQPTEASRGLGPRDQLRELFKGWCDPVHQLIETLDPSRANSLPLSDLAPLDRLVSGRVALVGDAGHATSPFLGQGASQAAESGLVLSRYLQTTSVSVQDALQRYERERIARVQAVTAGAREMGELATSTDPDSNELYYESIRSGGRQFVEAAEQLSVTGPLGRA